MAVLPPRPSRTRRFSGSTIDRHDSTKPNSDSISRATATRTHSRLTWLEAVEGLPQSRRQLENQERKDDPPKHLQRRFPQVTPGGTQRAPSAVVRVRPAFGSISDGGGQGNPTSSRAGPGRRLARVELRLQCLDLRVNVLLVLLVPRMPKLLAGLPPGLALRFLSSGDLRFHRVDRSPEDRATEVPHRVVDHLGALLCHLRHQGGVSGPDRLRDVTQNRLALVRVVKVEQRADEDSGRASDEHT